MSVDANGRSRQYGQAVATAATASNLSDFSDSIVRSSFVPVGILGGLGPLAGAHFYRRLIEKTPAENDSDHLSVVLISDPTIPSRIENLLGEGRSPVPDLVRLVRLLVEMGAEVIAVPSSTTHAYYQKMQDAVRFPVINLLSEVGRVVAESGSHRPAILATTPTVMLDLYRPYLPPSSDPIYPDPETQREIQDLVTALKRRNSISYLSERLQEILSRSWSEGMDSAVLACTELCLAETNDLAINGLTVPMISATEVLADAVFRLALRS